MTAFKSLVMIKSHPSEHSQHTIRVRGRLALMNIARRIVFIIARSQLQAKVQYIESARAHGIPVHSSAVGYYKIVRTERKSGKFPRYAQRQQKGQQCYHSTVCSAAILGSVPRE